MYYACQTSIWVKKKHVRCVPKFQQNKLTQNFIHEKELVLLEASLTKFYQKFYVTEIFKLSFTFPHTKILGEHHWKERHDAFKHWGSYQDVLCCRSYINRVVEFFYPNPIWILYWQCACLNISHCIRKHLSYATAYSIFGIRSFFTSCCVYTHSFLMTVNRILPPQMHTNLLKKIQLLFAGILAIWDNTNCSYGQYRCVPVLYLLIN